MSWNVAAIEKAHAKAVEIIGPMGNYDVHPTTFYNVILFTLTYGNIWYGDLTREMATKVKALSEVLHTHIHIVADTSNALTV